MSQIFFNPNKFTKISGIFDSVTNGTISVDAYTYINWGSEMNNFGVLQITLTATTVTLWITNDDSDTSNASAHWTDITAAMAGVTSITTSSDIIIDTPLKVSRLRIVHTPTNATNSFTLRLANGN